MPTIVIAAHNVAAFPESGGHFWVYLQYVLGLRRLGFEVYWLEAFRTKGRTEQEAAALSLFRARMEQHGLGGKHILYLTHSKEPLPGAPSEYLGMNRDEAEAIYERADLPRLTSQPLELALFLRNKRDYHEAAELERRGWRIQHSRKVAATTEAYQAYIRQSRGEFSCAKRSCIEFQSAWISDRTLCYLASGKPVVVQDTGPSAVLPNGEGMFRCTTAQQAANAFQRINADYERHCHAARKLAATHFDAKQVVAKILRYALDETETPAPCACARCARRRGQQPLTAGISGYDRPEPQPGRASRGDRGAARGGRISGRYH